MIGRLSGILAHRGHDHALVDVRGVGYVVHCSERTLAALPGVGEAVTLHTDLLVREDLLQLFGFATRREKDWHRLLISVQGVGSKASLAVLGALGSEGVGRAIILEDSGAIRAAPGVGPKIAHRIVNELRDKAPAVMASADDEPEEVVRAPEPGTPKPAAEKPGSAPPRRSAQPAAISALTNLGYAPAEAARAVTEALDEAGEDEAALIRAALRRLAPA